MITQLTKKQELALLYLAISSEAFGGIGARMTHKNDIPYCALGHLLDMNAPDVLNSLTNLIEFLWDVPTQTRNDKIVLDSGKERISFKEWCEGMGIEDSIYSIKS